MWEFVVTYRNLSSCASFSMALRISIYAVHAFAVRSYSRPSVEVLPPTRSVTIASQESGNIVHYDRLWTRAGHFSSERVYTNKYLAARRYDRISQRIAYWKSHSRSQGWNYP